MGTWGKRPLAALLCGLLAVSVLGCAQTEPAQAAPVATAPAAQGTPQPSLPADATRVDKAETVYVTASADGTVREVSVETVLKSQGGTAIEDVSNLAGIRNTEGEETFTQVGDALTWQDLGQDIHYKGDSSAQLPVTVHISYQLDGKAIAPEQLAGRAGRVTIRFDYRNTATHLAVVDGAQTEVPVPFAVVSTLALPGDKFSNIQVTNGKLVDLGDQTLVLGTAFPGLRGSLRLEEYEPTEGIDLPEYLEITADTVDFALDFTATVVTTGMFAELDPADLDDVDALVEDMDELADASRKLADGAGELLEGADSLHGYLAQYAAGASALDDGAAALAQGLAELDRQKGQLAQGAAALQAGLEQVNAMLAALPLASLPAATPETPAMQTGETAMNTPETAAPDQAAQLAAQLAALQAALRELEAGSGQLAAGIDALNEGIGQLAGGAQALQDGTGQLRAAGDALAQGAGTLAQGARALRDGSAEFDREGIQSLRKLAGEDLAALAGRLRALQQADEAYDNFAGLAEGQTGSVRFIIETDEIKK